MDVLDNEYLEHYAVKITEPPRKVPINGWEIDGNHSIGLDDLDGHGLGVLRWDEWEKNQGWKIKPGTDKRWTRVIVQKEGVNATDVFYEFDGLILDQDLREWFKTELNLKYPPVSDKE